MAKNVKVDGYVKAKSVTHKSISLTNEPAGEKPTWYSLSQRVFDYTFEKLNIGDHVRISLPADDPQGMVSFLEFLEKSEASQRPVDKYPTKQEQRIIDEWDKSKEILWQSCMKIAIEVEKAFMCGEKSPDRVVATKNVLVITNNLYEGSLRKYRGQPPIPEAKEE